MRPTLASHAPLHRTSCGLPPPESRGRKESGFTLIEMLVALTIFSLAALALLRLEGATLAGAARLQDQALAQIVARNVAIEAITDPVPPTIGRESGEIVNGGRAWGWTRLTAYSPEPRILMITVNVTAASGSGRASLTVFRKGET